MEIEELVGKIGPDDTRKNKMDFFQQLFPHELLKSISLLKPTISQIKNNGKRDRVQNDRQQILTRLGLPLEFK